MTWRDILVFADASEDGLVRAETANKLAEANQAHLEIDVVAVQPAPPYGPGSDLLAQAYQDALAAARRQGLEAVQALQHAFPAKPDRRSVELRECFHGEIRALAARASRTADLVVLPQPSSLDESGIDTDLMLGALIGGGRPCLVVPRWIRPHAFGRRVLIAWKGAPEAARAVQGALPFLKAAECVRICTANPRAHLEGEDEASLQRLATYLLRHGAHVESVVRRSAWEGPEKLFASELEGFGADMLVMGGYSRPRLQEIVFGGMTASMLRDSRVPILIAH